MRASPLLGGTIFCPCRALSDKYFSISDDYEPDRVIFVLTSFVFKTTSIRRRLIWARFRPTALSLLEKSILPLKSYIIPPQKILCLGILTAMN